MTTLSRAKLSAGLNRTWAGHHGESIASNGTAAHFDDGALTLKISACQAKGLRHRPDFFDAAEPGQCVQVQSVEVAQQPNQGVPILLRDVCLETQVAGATDDIVDVRLSDTGLHDNDH